MNEQKREKANISQVSREEGTKIKLLREVTCQSLFRNHGKRLHKRTFHRTLQSLRGVLWAHCLVLTHSRRQALAERANDTDSGHAGTAPGRPSWVFPQMASQGTPWAAPLQNLPTNPTPT